MTKQDLELLQSLTQLKVMSSLAGLLGIYILAIEEYEKATILIVSSLLGFVFHKYLVNKL